MNFIMFVTETLSEFIPLFVNRLQRIRKLYQNFKKSKNLSKKSSCTRELWMVKAEMFGLNSFIFNHVYGAESMTSLNGNQVEYL